MKILMNWLRTRNLVRTCLAAVTWWFFSVSLSSVAEAEPTVINDFALETYSLLDRPVQMTFDPSGNLFVGRGTSSTVSHPIYHIALGGAPVSEYGSAIRDPDGALFDENRLFADTPSSVLVAGQVNLNGRISAVRPDESVYSVFSGGLLRNPGILAFDNAGRLLISDPQARRVFASAGNAPSLLINTSPYKPRDIAVDSNNHIYLSLSNGAINKYDWDGSLLQSDFATGYGEHPRIAFGKGGLLGDRLYVVGDGLFSRIDQNGDSELLGSGFGPYVSDLEFGPDKALYISDGDNNRILRFTAVPEPSSLVLLLLAIPTALVLQRRLKLFTS